MKISILSIGDELLIGQTINTNASFIGEQLTLLGADIIQSNTVGDNSLIIQNEIERLLNFSDFLILTGGLGPTDDDITKPTLCEFFDDTLILHIPTLTKLENNYSKKGRELSERNKSQAYLPAKCTVIDNSVGNAPGMFFERDGKYLISLPGVPSEMKAIMKDFVLPFVENEIFKSNQTRKYFRTIRTLGIPESNLAELIGKLPLESNESLAYLPSYQGVKLRIGTENSNEEKAKKRLADLFQLINSKANDFIYSDKNIDPIEYVHNKLINSNLKISIAESCTGGLLGSELTNLPGSSKYFIGGIQVYSNFAKSEFLHVPQTVLDTHGAVSEETAVLLAHNVRIKFNTDYGISITGIAGPDGGTDEKPVGTVWIGFSKENNVYAKKFIFTSNREINRKLSVSYALYLLIKELQNI